MAFMCTHRCSAKGFHLPVCNIFCHSCTALSCKLNLGEFPLKFLKALPGFCPVPENSRKEQAKCHFVPR